MYCQAVRYVNVKNIFYFVFKMVEQNHKKYLLAQYDVISRDRRYFDSLLWQHLRRFFAINSILLGLAFSQYVTSLVRTILLVIAAIWSYVSAFAFAKCYLLVCLLVDVMKDIEQKLNMKEIPRRTEEITANNSFRGSRFMIPFQARSTPKITFFVMLITCIILAWIALWNVIDFVWSYFSLPVDSYLLLTRLISFSFIPFLPFIFHYFKPIIKKIKKLINC